jgi:hypothetical protein
MENVRIEKKPQIDDILRDLGCVTKNSSFCKKLIAIHLQRVSPKGNSR